MNRNAITAVAFLVCSPAWARPISTCRGTSPPRSGTPPQAPAFEVDPLWPKPLPNHWVLGSTIGVSVDENDHVWIIIAAPRRSGNNEKGLELKPPTGECCAGAPPVLEFDQAGNLLNHWGGPAQGYEWPTSNHGITVDYKGNVWIGGNGEGDAQLLKFTKSGKFLLQVGKANARAVPGGQGGRVEVRRATATTTPASAAWRRSSWTRRRTRPSSPDGYLNKRVVVLDADTGAFKRYWGAYGNKPDDTNLGPLQPRCAARAAVPQPRALRRALGGPPALRVRPRQRSHPGVHARRQVPQGSVHRQEEPGLKARSGTSPSRRTRSRPTIFLADGRNMKIRILKRDTLEELTNFGDGGRQPGQFYAPHSIAVDSKGNLYTTETYEGKRVQRFVYKGLRPVAAKDQGVVWPR
jgi:hypothetical protein